VTALGVSAADRFREAAVPVSRKAARPYSNPYLAGIGLGLVLLAAFVLVGRGLGASGGFASAAAATSSVVAPDATRANAYFARYLGADGKPTLDWLVLELTGVLIGGFISATLAGRLSRTIERGPRIADRTRLVFAFAGGSIMGIGAMLARGCTSGQALTGGALLSVGSWLFIGAAFAAAYAVAPLLKRAWL
jgi:uncharacterized membrane protein YedE/YeeE